MFLKPFRTKTNVAIKGSDRKRLRSDVTKAFCHELSGELIVEIVPNKEEMSVMKLYSHKGENILVYCLSKNPIFFQHENVLYPTITTVWKYPSMLPCVTTQPQVIHRLLSGADLMLPGVIVPKSGLAQFNNGQVVAINAIGNKSPLAVGVALMSSRDMIEAAGMRGRGIKIIHTFGDHLWQAGEKQQPPQIPMDDDECLKMMQDVNGAENDIDYFSEEHPLEEVTNKQKSTKVDEEPPAEELDELNIKDEVVSEDEEDFQDERSETEIMDELLKLCFLTALKQKLKDSELPILTSTFYRTHVLPCCPANRSLDIKKTSHKKLGKYLRHVASTGLIEVKELSKGNDNLISVLRSHADIRSFQPLQSTATETASTEGSNTVASFGVVTQKKYEPPEISVIHCVSAVSLPLFSQLGYKKGSAIPLVEIREAVTKYVRQNELTRADNPRMVTLDPLLHRAMYDKGGNDILQATWEDVFKKVISKLQPCHQLCFKGLPPIIRTGGPPSIKILVQQRASNKKVTMVESLESFLIEPQQFADSMRKKAQASTSISEIPIGGSNKTSQQVLIQGNQVSLVERLLTGPEYGIPRRYLKGLENAPKPKKKGR